MNRWKWMILCLLLLFVFGICPADAQVLDRAEIRVIVTIPQILWVRVNASELVFSEEDFDTTKDAVMTEEGILASKLDAVQIEVAGNVPHALYISASADAFAGPNNTSLSSSQMQFRLISSAGSSAESPWHTLGTRNARQGPVFSSNAAGRNVLRMDVQLLATWLDTPGTYRGSIVYTVVPLVG